MQFNDTTNSTGLVQDVTFWTGADTNEYTLVDRVRNINAWYHKIVTMILQSQDEWDFDDSNHTDFPILTTDLVASQQDYKLPTSIKMLKIKRLEISYDGTNWYKGEPFDLSERGSSVATNNLSDFTSSEPYYDLQNNSVFLYPIPDTNITSGLKMWIQREIDEFTSADTTQEPGFDEPFHRMLSIGASYDWCLANGRGDKATALGELLVDYETRLRDYYGSKQRDRHIVLTPSYQNYN